MRVFYALKPDPLSLEQLITVQHSLPLEQKEDTLSPREKLHMTLLFCGDVADEHVTELQNLLASIMIPKPILLRGRYFSFFGNTYSKRLVLLFQNEGELLAIHEKLSAGAVKAKLPCDVVRSFRPHITLATVKSRMPLPQPTIVLEFAFSEIILYKSKLSETGSVYTALASTSA